MRVTMRLAVTFVTVSALLMILEKTDAIVVRDDGHVDVSIGDILFEILGSPFAPVSPGNLSAACRAQSQLYLQELDKLTSWAMHMYDAGSKIPSGVLTGNMQQLGNFDECLNIAASHPSSHQLIKGQHCSAAIRLFVNGFPTVVVASEEHSGKHAMSRKSPTKESRLEERSSDFVIAMAAASENADGPRHLSVSYTWSYCVPASCTPDDVATALRHRLSALDAPGQVEVAVGVAANQCYQRNDEAVYSRFTQLDVAAICIFVLFGLLLASSTTYDLVIAKKSALSAGKHGRSYTLFSSFSLYTNGKRLLDTTRPKDTLACVDGIRVLTLGWVLYAHNYYMTATSPQLNSLDTLHARSDWMKMIVMNGTLSTDTFFLISGILLCYLFMKEQSKKMSNFSMGMFYLHRYLRLSPPYAMVILFQSTLLFYMGSGPLWNAKVGVERDNCLANWWTNLLYVNNYVDVARPCMGHTWYLAVDMQLYWLSPLVVYPLWRWQRIGKAILAIMLTTTIIVPFVVTFTQQLAGAMLYTTDNLMVGIVYVQVYTRTYCHGGSYFVGIAVGYFLYQTKEAPMKWTKLQVALGWLGSTGTCLAVLYGVYGMYQPTHVYDAVEAATYASLHRPAWALGVAWVIVACVKGYGGPVNRLLSWQIFLPFCRLSYCAYLCHMAVMLYSAATTRTSGYMSTYNMVFGWLGNLNISFLLAAIISLGFEMPFLNLERSLLRDRAKKAPVTNEANLSTIELSSHDLVKSVKDRAIPGPNDISNDTEMQYNTYDNVCYRR